MEKKVILSKIFNRVDEVEKSILEDFDVLDDKYSELSELITLGDNWDNPFELAKQLAKQPGYFAYWSSVLKTLKFEEKKLQKVYDTWKSYAKNKLRVIVLELLLKEGYTQSKAADKMTATTMEDYFNVYYVSNKHEAKHKSYLRYIMPLNKIKEKIEQTEIIVSAFKHRKDLLPYLSTLVREMINNGMIDIRMKKKRHKA